MNYFKQTIQQSFDIYLPIYFVVVELCDGSGRNDET